MRLVTSENSRGRKEDMSNRVSFTRLIDTIELSVSIHKNRRTSPRWDLISGFSLWILERAVRHVIPL